MVLSTYHEDAKIRVQKENDKIQQQKEFKETTLPKNIPERKDHMTNPFLDTNVRQLIDDFVMTWHKIIMDLLNFDNYENIKAQNEWWDVLLSILALLKKFFGLMTEFFTLE